MPDYIFSARNINDNSFGDDVDANVHYLIVQDELEKLCDLKYLYNAAEIIQKQNMVKLVFDNKLYYRQQVYRTPWLMQIFQPNSLILKEKNLLI